MTYKDKHELGGVLLPEYNTDYMKKGGWIQKAVSGMRKDRPCTGSKFGGPACPPGTKRYNLAKTLRKMARGEGGLDLNNLFANADIDASNFEGMANLDQASTIDTTQSDALSGAAKAIPAVDPWTAAIKAVLTVAGPVLKKHKEQNQMLDNMQAKFDAGSTSNPFKMEAGGQIMDGSPEDMMQLAGNTHAQGGINIGLQGLPSANPVAEVEDKENIATMYDNLGNARRYVFSKKLKV